MTVFADTSYWVGVADPRDSLHAAAQWMGVEFGPLLTSEYVLVELLAYFCDWGTTFRTLVTGIVREAFDSATVDVVPASSELFLRSLALYESCLDKGYSLVDCTSMLIMRERGLTEALTADRHFEQEGFVALLRDAAAR